MVLRMISLDSVWPLLVTQLWLEPMQMMTMVQTVDRLLFLHTPEPAWTEQAKLTASDGAELDFFGSSVAIAGDTIVVGARLDDVNGITDSGSAYVFTRTGTTWTEQAKLTASDGAAADFFGTSVAIAGDTIVVGALGMMTMAQTVDLLMFSRAQEPHGSQQAKLTASDGAG